MTGILLNLKAKAPRADWLRRGGLFRKFVISFVGLVVFVLVARGDDVYINVSSLSRCGAMP